MGTPPTNSKTDSKLAVNRQYSSTSTRANYYYNDFNNHCTNYYYKYFNNHGSNYHHYFHAKYHIHLKNYLTYDELVVKK